MKAKISIYRFFPLDFIVFHWDWHEDASWTSKRPLMPIDDIIRKSR